MVETIKRMMKNTVMIALCFSFVVSALPAVSYAQNTETTSAPELTGTRKQIATIIFAGLAGAILGLSTLSFYGRPQEKLSNIAVGFAVGIIGGVVVTTYNVARSPYEGLQSMQLQREEVLSEPFVPQQIAFTPTLMNWSF